MRDKLIVVLIGILGVLFLTNFVFATENLMALQGNVQQSGVDLTSGNITVNIYDAYSGGNLIYNSSSDFYNTISSGKYDIMLGNGTQTLTLNYGGIYYLEMFVNSEKLTFNGLSRQVFQSSVGNISLNSVAGGANIVMSNGSATFSAGQNVSTGTGGWFKGLFNWVVDAGSSTYLSFNGTSLSLSSSVTQWLYNQTYSGSTFNATYDGYNGSYGKYWNTNFSNIQGNVFNVTYAGFNSTSNIQGLLNNTVLSVSGLNVTGTSNFNGGWQTNGVSIIGGNVFAQALYVYNISSLGVSNLDVNGSIIPVSFNNTFDIGNATYAWGNGYFASDVIIQGGGVKKWLYNFSSVQGNTFNSSYLTTANNIFDQTLNTTSNVNFANITSTGNLSIVGATFINDSKVIYINTPVNGAWVDAIYLTKGQDASRNWITWNQGSSGGDWRIGMTRGNIGGYSLSFYNGNGSTSNASFPGMEVLRLTGNTQAGNMLLPNGSLGVSTLTPGATFDVRGNVSLNNTLYTNGASVGIGTSAPSVALEVWNSTSGGNQLKLNDGRATTTFRVVDGGQGQAVLDIDANPVGGSLVGNTSSIRIWRSTNTNGSKSVQFFRGDNSVNQEAQIGVNGSNTYFQTGVNGGEFGINTTAPVQIFNVVGNGNITGTTYLANNLFVNSSDVGIGTTIPVSQFNVVGTPGTNLPLGIYTKVITATGSAPTTVATSYYLGVGYGEFSAANATPSYRLIGFGYKLGGNYPAYMGYTEVANDGQTYGDLVFGTRTVASNTQPTERMRIMNNGNIGIGTTSATQLLDVRGLANFTGDIYLNNQSTVAQWLYNQTTAATGSFLVNNSNVDLLDVNLTNNKMFANGIIINQSGGIVFRNAGTLTLNPTANRLVFGSPGAVEDTDFYYVDTGTFTIDLRAGGSRILKVGNSAGKLKANFQVNANNFYVDGNKNNTGINTITPGAALDVLGNGSINNTLFIQNNGFVGIGASVPSSTFDVRGNVSLNNTIYTSAGGVGIGTANPITTNNMKVEVAGGVNITGNNNLTIGGGQIYWDSTNARLVIKVS